LNNQSDTFNRFATGLNHPRTAGEGAAGFEHGVANIIPLGILWEQRYGGAGLLFRLPPPGQRLNPKIP
jgi:hypothetical protein